MDLEQMRKSTEQLMKWSDLTFCPIGIRFASCEEEIPEDAIRPYRDRGEKWAICQLIQKARHEHVTYAMTQEDHWCWYPQITFGHVNVEKGNYDYDVLINNVGIPDKEREIRFVDKIPHLEYGTNYATVLGPLDSIGFVPDIILIYCDNAQLLRRLIGCIKYMDGDMLPTELDYVNSCCWSMIPTHQTRKFRVTIPDPGEYERAEIGASELILSVPAERYVELCEVNEMKERRFAKRPGLHTGLVPYFARAQFMDNLYKYWGLEHGREISWTEEQRGYDNNSYSGKEVK